jgi:c-di-GMP-binding flagellar brake protein YcgR
MVHETAAETDRSLLEQCAVPDPRMRLKLLQSLSERGRPLVLHPGGAHDVAQPVGATLTAVGEASLELELAPDPAQIDSVRAAAWVTVVAQHDSAKVQFELRGFSIHQTAQRTCLSAKVPDQVARIQRREAFRVEPPVHARPKLWVRLGEALHEVRVGDLSATGLSFEAPADGSAPQPGTLLKGCRLEFPAAPPIPCELEVRSVRGGDGKPRKVGCAFSALPPSAERAVQVFVNNAQLRARRLRPAVT